MRPPVTGKTEAGRHREIRARETRGRIIDAGLQLFLERGYIATTVDAIAHKAGVAPATVYQAFGTKQAVLTVALDVAIAGDDRPVGLLERDWVSEARREPDARLQLRIIVSGACQVAARTAALKVVMRDAAASEAGARDLLRQDHEQRHRTQEAFVDLLIERRPLRAEIDRRHAVDTFFALVNSDTFELLVTQRGWTAAEWQDWVIDILERVLFGAPG